MKLLQVELYKLKRSPIWLIATILPLFSALQGKMFVDSKAGENTDVWQTLFVGAMSFYTWIALPVLITVVMAMIGRIEHSSNSWKQVLAMPVKRGQIYFTKLIVSMIVLFYSMVMLWIGLIGAGQLLGQDTIPYHLVFGTTAKTYVSVLPIIALQFYLSMAFSHIGVPLAVGAGLTLPSMLIANSAKYWIFYPWTYPIVTSLTDMFGMGSKGSIMYSVCVLVPLALIAVGFMQFKTKDILA